MKYRMVIKANQEEMFAVFKQNFLDDYFASKGKLLPEEKLKKGFTYEKNVSRDKRKGHIRMATVKVLEFKEPSVYRVFYESDRYRKITGVELKQLDEKNVEIILEEVQDKIVINEEDYSKEYVPSIKESDEIKKASWWKKYQYRYLAKSIQLRKKDSAKKDQERLEKEKEKIKAKKMNEAKA